MSVVEKIKKKNKVLEEQLLKQSEETPIENVPEELQQEETTVEEPKTEEAIEYPVEDEEKWKHKYNVLQGKYNAEVPRLQQEIKKLQEENALLLTKLELLEKVVTEKKAQPEDVVEDHDEDIKTLKEDFPEIYNAVQKLIKKTYNPKVDNILEELNQQKLKEFYEKMDSLVPNWKVLNTDSKFIEWLQETDELSGQTRHQLLLSAFNDLNANRVSKFFLSYINEKQPQKHSHVSPSSRQITSTINTGKKIYKQSFIEDFYRRKALGKISREEAVAMEREFLAAMKEGRIISG